MKFRLSLSAAALITLAFVALPAAAQISVPAFGTPLTQNFNTLAISGTANTTLPAGWALTETGGGSRDNEQYGADIGSSSTGDTYSYGASANTERAFGGLQTGSLIATIGARYVNNTGGTITNITVSYTGEQWRRGQNGGPADRLDFQFSTDATSLSNGTWTDANALDFSSPFTTTTGARDGNAVGNRTLVSATVNNLLVENGSQFWIRYNDFNNSGSDDGLAIDDFSLTANGLNGILITIGNAAVIEGNSGVRQLAFTAQLYGGNAPVGGQPFTVSTTNGTATTANNDYVAQTNQAYSVAAGTRTATVNVAVNGDAGVEPDETMSVTVTTATGATIVGVPGTGTIYNDEGAVTIAGIQGSGAIAIGVGSLIVTSGNVVTAVGDDGFFIQSQGVGDGNMLTSDGIYVYTGSDPNVVFEDLIDVRGTVAELNPDADGKGFTVITGSPFWTSLGQAPRPVIPLPIALDAVIPSPVPTAATCDNVSLTFDTIETRNFECLEGMFVSIADGIILSGNQGFGQTACNAVPAPANDPGSPDCLAEFFASSQPNKLYRGVGVAYPNITGDASLPVFDGNPEVFEIDVNRLSFLTQDDPQVLAGTRFNAVGMFGVEFSDYELWTTAFATVDGTEPVLPQPVKTTRPLQLAIGSQNILRIFDTVDDPISAGNDYDACTVTAPGSADECPTLIELNRRLGKTSDQVRNILLGPAVLAVQECENLNVLNELAARIAADSTGALQYAAYLFEGNDFGGIDIGMLVRSDVTVNSVTQLGATERFTIPPPQSCGPDTPNCLVHDRTPMLLEATIPAGTGSYSFAVLAIHNRSLGGVEFDPADAQDDFARLKRLTQAQSIGQMVQNYQLAHPSTPLIVVGDFNAYEFTDGYVDVTGQIKGTALDADNYQWATPIPNPPLVDAVYSLAPADRYSFSFRGSLQALDHALLSRDAARQFADFSYSRGNSDVARYALYNPLDSTGVRSADHDGFVLHLQMDRIFANDYELLLR